MHIKDEAIREDCNRFIAYLKSVEGDDYQIIDANVKTISGKKDFDFLLKANSGTLLALEITWLTESPDELKAEAMRRILIQRIEQNLKEIPFSGLIFIDIPWRFDFSRGSLLSILKQKSVVISMQIIDVLQSIEEKEERIITTDLGIIKISRMAGDKNLLFTSSEYRFGHYGSDLTYFTNLISRIIPKKNQQLEYEADRRVLLIGNACYIEMHSAIESAILSYADNFSENICNISEIFVDFGVNKFKKLYP